MGDLSRKLCSLVEKHLDWGSRIASIFILTYCYEQVALREAKRRVGEEKEDVIVYMIDIRKRDKPVEYRNMQFLARRLRVKILEYA